MKRSFNIFCEISVHKKVSNIIIDISAYSLETGYRDASSFLVYSSTVVRVLPALVSCSVHTDNGILTGLARFLAMRLPHAMLSTKC